MANRLALVRQSDLTRMIKGALAGGFQIGRVEVKPDGSVNIIGLGEDGSDLPNPCDRLMKR